MNRNVWIMLGLGMLMMIAVIQNINFEQLIKPASPANNQSIEEVPLEFDNGMVYIENKDQPETVQSTDLQASMAPAFELTTLNGEPFQFPLAEKKTSAIVFWASWCGNCRAFAPNLEKVHQKYADKLQVIGVNVSDDLERAKEFASEFAFSFPTVFDDGVNGYVAEQYEINAVPTMVFVDPDGNIIDKQLGGLMADELEEKFKQVLK